MKAIYIFISLDLLRMAQSTRPARDIIFVQPRINEQQSIDELLRDCFY